MLDKLKFLWEDKVRYVLGPRPDFPDSLGYFPNMAYVPYIRHSLEYTCVLVPNDIAPTVVEKMIQSGAKIIDNMPKENFDEQVAHLWTDKVQEFVLKPNPFIDSKYTIFHEELKEFVDFTHESASFHKEVVKKMIKAGVRILEASE
jgi:hypothetical protein